MIPIDKTLAEIEAADKAFATMRAGLALAGYELHIVTSPETGRGSYMVGRWGHFHELPDWASLVEWAARAGVAP